MAGGPGRFYSATAAAGTLFIVSTPIGNLADLSSRARAVLRDADLLLAEDTRHTAQLLRSCGIARSHGELESLHEHNERDRAPVIVGDGCRRGAAVAVVSDAGTPLVSDPGAALVSAAVAAGVPVVAVPGPCAAIAARCRSRRCPPDDSAFEGFLPAEGRGTAARGCRSWRGRRAHSFFTKRRIACCESLGRSRGRARCRAARLQSPARLPRNSRPFTGARSGRSREQAADGSRHGARRDRARRAGRVAGAAAANDADGGSRCCACC